MSENEKKEQKEQKADPKNDFKPLALLDPKVPLPPYPEMPQPEEKKDEKEIKNELLMEEKNKFKPKEMYEQNLNSNCVAAYVCFSDIGIRPENEDSNFTKGL